MHWRMNELWFLFPLPPPGPAPLCSESASHRSKLCTCASGAAANALPALNGIFPAKYSRMNSLWVRVLGPGPDPLRRESDSQATIASPRLSLHHTWYERHDRNCEYNGRSAHVHSPWELQTSLPYTDTQITIICTVAVNLRETVCQ